MASRYKTGRLEEALLASDEVVQLAKQVLSKEQFNEAIHVSEMLVSSKSDKREAILKLRTLVSPPPKRPLYYAQHELGFLPRWTRNAIRYLGDYINLLTKKLAFKLTANVS